MSGPARGEECLADIPVTRLLLTCSRPDLLTNLGVRAANTFTAAQVPNYAPHFIIGNFLLSYIISSTRFPKVAAGIDNNISPRGDLGERGERAVKEGKLSQERLEQLRRLQGAHSNNIEHFPFLVGALAMAVQGGVDTQTINKYGLIYTIIRAVYTLVYYHNTTPTAARTRSVLFWASNITCIRLLWFAGKAFNVAKNVV